MWSTTGVPALFSALLLSSSRSRRSPSWPPFHRLTFQIPQSHVKRFRSHRIYSISHHEQGLEEGHHNVDRCSNDESDGASTEPVHRSDEDGGMIELTNNKTKEERGMMRSWASVVAGLPSQSVLLLNMVAILWGTQHAVIKMVVSDSDPGQFTFLRFGLAALLASPYTPGIELWSNEEKPNESDLDSVRKAWRWGIEMGFWLFLGFSFQAIGLESTTAQKSGFLLYLNVKFVPIFARVFLGRDISIVTWLSAFMAVAGTAFLAFSSDSGGFSLDHVNEGDLWSIAAAAASAMFILRLERASVEAPDAAGLNAACLWVVTLFAGVWTLVVQGATPDPSSYWNIVSSHAIEILYLSGVTTALANWIQTKAQKDISAERASVIYAMDPVYGAVFASLFLGESLPGISGWIGAALITIAAATNAFLDVPGSVQQGWGNGHTGDEDSERIT